VRYVKSSNKHGFEVFSVNSVDQLLACLPHRSRYFSLFLAWDAPEIEPAKLAKIFEPLVNRGLAYFCAWGVRCEDVHDAVDHCVVFNEIDGVEEDYLLMTTWHARESLEEALWFFSMNAIPAEEHVIADFERYAVIIGNREWSSRVESFRPSSTGPG